jgi:ribose 5-phosphate isomerase RpiB
MSTNGQVLQWSKRVLCAADLCRSLNCHREIVLPPRAVVTPLAQEELRHEGIRITREDDRPPQAGRATLGYAQERPHPLVQSAVTALAREGIPVRELVQPGDDLLCRWARAVAECVAGGECAGGVLFCQDPGLACCVANKLGGLRAVWVSTVSQAARATLTLGANLLVVEMPGRTFFEVRQILRALAASRPACPEGVACTLQELDGHAHR